MLSIRDLTVRIGPYQIVSIDELHLTRGRRLGLVGESGSGKTMTAMSIVGLQPREAQITGSITFDGRELVGLTDSQLAAIRGTDIGVIFQDPLRALNPTMRIGKQIGESVRLHSDLRRSAVNARVIDLMTQVQLPEPEQLARRYPHQLSGGQRQRVVIAMAIAARPKLLIADEPTTALDVTVQKGILDLLAQLSEEYEMAMLFVSHSLGVVRKITHDVAVLYGGRVVETGPSSEIIDQPRHRYTEALIGANPGQADPDAIEAALGTPLTTIPGSVPALDAFPSGCRFRDRCAHSLDTCAENPPVTRMSGGHRFTCWNPTHTPVGGELDGAAR
ncbi:ABC transporter ATP-binding protein [Phytoactinopolyspora alkaliphila]|uniref:ABC transporter ATP-binding protein n=1 Tax=Phytoactinopolyspora alkaliphila TaxID=1783498 RepID=A0A6N9YIJ3_9ACTN|nr:ABC transporter ATP-binding protein [Phytoactinopolyspora alkaliphila]NED94755.1 ABC transporter ATP-binding protein [Phytoactinopolyspora alkaliphila]